MTVADRIQHRVNERNRAIALEAIVEAALGAVFTVLTFGSIFWLTWLAGFFCFGSLGLRPWQLAGIVTAVFIVASVHSAWRRVDPLAGLEPMSDEQLWLLVVSLGSECLLAFNPRQATAGAAVVLIGGPAALLGALGTWRHRLGADRALIEEAAELLDECRREPAVDDLASPRAALLLRRLALIKVVSRGVPARLALTEAGQMLL